jgi:hypothetical protein
MREICSVTFECADLLGAEFDAQSPNASRTLDTLLRTAPSFVRCPHHGIYNYASSLGAYNTIRIEKTGLFVIMHDGKCFGQHALLVHLEATLSALFPNVQFDRGHRS